MGGVLNSAEGLLGLSNGPQAPGGTFTQAKDLTDRNYLNPYGNSLISNAAQSGDVQSAIQDANKNGAANGLDTQSIAGLQDQLATGALTGSQYATQQVQNNPILGSLFGKGGQLEGAEGRLNDLQSQKFNLQPEDYDLYGQTSGNIARMFGSQGNQISQDLASRGLASAPSGAAGAMFSGLNGNQNEMLAQAQQQIMQQRFQNTQQQIAQQQNFVNSLGAQAGNDIHQQYGRQLAGSRNQAENQKAGVSAQTGQNDYNMKAFDENVANTPTNFFDMMTPYGVAKGVGMMQGGGGSPKTQGTPGGDPQLTGNKVTAASTTDDAAMYSDERLKANISPADREIENMLGNLSAYSYKYTPESLPAGTRYGILAQDLEKTPAGRSSVVEKQLGKAVDINSAVSLILASLANINKRLSRLEN